MSEVTRLKLEERRHCIEIAEIIELNDVEDFDDVSRLNAHVDELMELLKKFRDIHFRLEESLGTDEYVKAFPDSQATAESIKSQVRKCKQFKATLKAPVAGKKAGSIDQSRIRDEIEMCICKVDSVVMNFPLESLNSVDDIRLNISKVSDNIATYNYLIPKLASDDESYPKTLDKAIQYITEGMARVDELSRSVKVEAAESKPVVSSQKDLEILARLIGEIQFIGGSLEKLKDFKFTSLDDEELLDAQKDVRDKYAKCDLLTDKITLLFSQMPEDYENRKDILEKHSKSEVLIRGILDKYRDDLKKEVASRNVSKEKILSNNSLKISLAKFIGFDSALDIYSFQTEFERIVAKGMQTKLLPDYLKNNYLDGAALAAVKGLDTLSEIWARLKSAYGDTEILLRNKMKEVEKVGPIWKGKDRSKKVQALSKLIFVMNDLQELAQKHQIENDLYHGGGFQKVYDVIGNVHRDKFIRACTEVTFKVKKEKWIKLVEFLKAELRVQEEILLVDKGDKDNSVNSESAGDKAFASTEQPQYTPVDKSPKNKTLQCHLCSKTDHVSTKDHFGRQVIQYAACRMFTDKSPNARFQLVKDKGLCYQCLSPGATVDHGKHKSGTCFSKFACKHPSHSKFPRSKHVLLCEEHRDDQRNKDMLERYKKDTILKFNALPDYSKEISNSFIVVRASHHTEEDDVDEEEVTDSAIYIQQTILVEKELFNLFYDEGCMDSCSRRKAIDRLLALDKARMTRPPPITLGGVGDIVTVSEHGEYKVSLPLASGKTMKMRGVCLTQITCEFPKYPLGEVEKDIRKQYTLTGGNVDSLPRLPNEVGGDTDLMIGIKYLKYFPKFVYQLPCGLRIYESQFANPDGSRGVVGGPHAAFTELEKNLGTFMSLGTYLSQELQQYRWGKQYFPDCKLLSGALETPDDEDLEIPVVPGTVYPCSNPIRRLSKKFSAFEEVESAGCEVTFRCRKCRNCVDCKKSQQIQCMSIQAEVEQVLIDDSVEVNLGEGTTTATLPFLEDPKTALAPNDVTALAVYKSQVRKLDKCPNERREIIEAEAKMRELGFVDKLENLSSEQQAKILGSAMLHYLVWRVVYNPNSLSTPCRLVFDASHPTASGRSLNSILPKGMNSMNQLLQIVIRWFSLPFVFHSDVRKMYNTVKLNEDFWQYQLYYWHDQLSVDAEPYIGVVKTLIYGVRSSGNQAESALRKTADLFREDYPEACEAICKDTYVDDCLSGSTSEEDRERIADEMQTVVESTGFRFKAFTFSGWDPPSEFTTDGKSARVAGMKWFSKEDKISLSTGDMNFSKKRRGRKCADSDGIPEEFTRSDCASKVLGVFDLTGKAVPVTCAFKLDLRTLVDQKLSWQDDIPSEFKSLWLANFKTIQDLAEVKFERAVVPIDAVSLDVDTIDLGDASDSLICSAIYVRFLRKTGEYSCQLIFARSKLVPQDIKSIPRAELIAAHTNASTSHVVSLSLGDRHKGCVKLTDSQVSLFWICNTKITLKQWARNTVVDITRLSDRSKWFYVKSSDNLADMGTRRGATIADISSDSEWINGKEWMRGKVEDFPVSTVDEVRFQQADVESIRKESLRPEMVDALFVHTQDIPVTYVCSNLEQEGRKVDVKVLAERYAFSDYIIDPNRFRLRKVVRVLSIVIRFVKQFVAKWYKGSKQFFSEVDTKVAQNVLKYLRSEETLLTCGNTYPVRDSSGLVTYISCKPGLAVHLTDEDISHSLLYFYRKCTAEVKQFVSKKAYGKISVEKDQILYYSGRILPSQEFGGILKLSDVMLDLTSSTFMVPIVDRSSPFAYALVNEVHWYHAVAKHSGNETVWRYVLMYAYVLGGKEVVRSFRNDCTRCRYLAKRTVDVVMGPVSDYTLMLAPAFYISQVDIFGPVKAYSIHNKRGTVSVYILIFCCCTTGAINLKIMEDYSTSAFILGFIRFTCTVGYPKMLLPDEGSQLMKGCKDMQLSFTDIKQRLHVEHGVTFETCPVGGHNMHGRVERKIQHVKDVMSKELHKERLSPIQWETVGDQIANCVNDTPMAVGSVPSDVEQIDLLTPNRLLLGRNNDRSPVVPLDVSSNLEKLIQQNERIVTAWFECWLVSHVPKLVDQPKWFNSDADVQVGDVVLFLKKEKEFAGNYQYGIVKSIEISRDDKIRKVVVEYVNSSESTKRETRRSVREVVVIHPVDELGIVRELGEIATWVDMQKATSSSCSS